MFAHVVGDHALLELVHESQALMLFLMQVLHDHFEFGLELSVVGAHLLHFDINLLSGVLCVVFRLWDVQLFEFLDLGDLVDLDLGFISVKRF